MSERIRDEVVLKLDHVTKRFGGLTAVGDVTFEIKSGREAAVALTCSIL